MEFYEKSNNVKVEVKVGLGYSGNEINISSLNFDAESQMIEVKVQIGIKVETINISKEYAIEVGLINPMALLRVKRFN